MGMMIIQYVRVRLNHLTPGSSVPLHTVLAGTRVTWRHLCWVFPFTAIQWEISHMIHQAYCCAGSISLATLSRALMDITGTNTHTHTHSVKLLLTTFSSPLAQTSTHFNITRWLQREVNQLRAQAPMSQFCSVSGFRFMLHSSSSSTSPWLLRHTTSLLRWPTPHGTEHWGDRGWDTGEEGKEG